MKSFFKNLLVVVVCAGVLYGLYAWGKSRGVVLPSNPPPATSPPPSSTPTPSGSVPGVNATSFPLKVPDNYKIEVFADKISGARVTVFDVQGNMWVSRTSQGVITMLEIKDGKSSIQK